MAAKKKTWRRCEKRSTKIAAEARARVKHKKLQQRRALVSGKKLRSHPFKDCFFGAWITFTVTIFRITKQPLLFTICFTTTLLFTICFTTRTRRINRELWLCSNWSSEVEKLQVVQSKFESTNILCDKVPHPDSGFKWISPNLPIPIQASSTVSLPVTFTPSEAGSAMEVVHFQIYDGSLKFSACFKGVGFYSRKLIPHDQMWTLYGREQDKVPKLRPVTVIQRWWRRRLMRESVTKKWDQLIPEYNERRDEYNERRDEYNELIHEYNERRDKYNERRDEAARFIQQSWKSFVEQRKKERPSRAIGVIEGAVKYYLVRRKWIQSLNQLRARIRLEELIKLNGSAAMKSAMMTLKVSLHEVNHLQRFQSLMSSSNLTDDEKTMYQVLRSNEQFRLLDHFSNI